MAYEGIIEIDSDKAKKYGFTSDKFFGWLWAKNNSIIISFIESKYPGKGNFRALVNNILNHNLSVEIPTPLGKMQKIVRENGFKQKFVQDPEMGMVEVWIKSPNNFMHPTKLPATVR